MLHYLFWFDFFLEARAEILKKVFWSKRWHQKYILKLADLYCLVPVITYCKQFCLCLPQCWFPSCFHKTHDLPQHHRQLLQRLELKWGYWVSITEMKQTKIVLRNIYYSLQSKNSISLEVEDETKNFPDSAFGNYLCTSACKSKSEKTLFFLASHAPRNWRFAVQTSSVEEWLN